MINTDTFIQLFPKKYLHSDLSPDRYLSALPKSTTASLYALLVIVGSKDCLTRVIARRIILGRKAAPYMGGHVIEYSSIPNVLKRSYKALLSMP